MSTHPEQSSPQSGLTSENTPLLQTSLDSTAKQITSQASVTELPDAEAGISDTGKDIRQPESPKWGLLRNVVYTVLVIIVSVVFVKGFIDADDVDVSAKRLLSHIASGLD